MSFIKPQNSSLVTIFTDRIAHIHPLLDAPPYSTPPTPPRMHPRPYCSIDAPPRWSLPRSLRILLECILVTQDISTVKKECFNFTYDFFQSYFDIWYSTNSPQQAVNVLDRAIVGFYCQILWSYFCYGFDLKKEISLNHFGGSPISQCVN